MRCLVAADLVPRRAGQPLKVWAYISLADLMQLPGSAELVAEWGRQLSALWAGRRTAVAGAGGHQGLWLDGEAARGIACGAPVTPVIVGDINPAAFGDLIRLCNQLDKLQHGDEGTWPFKDQPGQDHADETQGGSRAGRAAASRTRPPAQMVPCPGRRCCRPSSARRPNCNPAPAGWPRSCARSSSAT
jgi:hypothetical protein